MSKDTQSHSQLLFIYGPGAMLDLPDQAVVVSGLDSGGWSQTGNSIEESRLTDLLRQLEGNRAATTYPALRTPPVHDEDRNDDISPAVQVRIFPEWFICDVDHLSGQVPSGETRRRLVRFEDLDWKNDKPVYRDSGKKNSVNPIRFVAACKKGHLQDISWRDVVHRNGDRNCRQPMAWVERGVSADPGDMAVACGCGARVTVADLYKPHFLGGCNGISPWLTPRRDTNGTCAEDLHLLPRSATNAYFPQTVSVISMPVAGDQLAASIEKHWGNLLSWTENAGMAGMLIQLIRGTPTMAPDFIDFTDADIRAAIDRRREGLGETSTTKADPRVEEFDRLAADVDIIGRDGATSHLFAERLSLADLDVPQLVAPLISGIVRIHRLREVACLYGFTRIAAMPTALESELNEINLAVEGAPLAREISWYPAVEQFGEGVFVRFNSAHIDAWQARAAVKERVEQLRAGEKLEADHRNLSSPEHLGPAYWAIHTLSHALMAELAIDCGYPLSSLKERIYASKTGGATPRHGLLIYTSTAGGQGTLGGLSHLADRIPRLMAAAIEKLSPCSNDPVCSEHAPGDAHDDRHLHGAACHACLLVPETSCEARNGRLDRKLLWPGHAQSLI
jgi:hypothetical protein